MEEGKAQKKLRFSLLQENLETCLLLSICILIPFFMFGISQFRNTVLWVAVLMELLGGILTVGYLSAFLGIYRGEKQGLERFINSFSKWMKWGAATLWKTFWLVLWTLLFVIPGLVKAIAYSQYYFILAEYPKVSVKEALKLSEIMMKGNKLLWLRKLAVFLPVLVLPALIAGFFYEQSAWALLLPAICYLFAIPYATFVFTDLYETVKQKALCEGRIRPESFGVEVAESIQRHLESDHMRKKKYSKKGLFAFCMVFGIAVGVSAINGSDTAGIFDTDSLAVIDIKGTISETDGAYYNQQYLLNAVDEIREDNSNKGILLRINSPGGAVYQIDELYLKLMDYKKQTGRPIYAAIETQAASGGYYEACAADKIYANRNALIGSIGVFIGEFLDVSDLLDELGVKVTFIKSAPNKTMGNIYQPMTEEQKAIYQSICDEMYGRFVKIVSKGRNMPEDQVRKLADGRIYSAKQAHENGLIDGVETIDSTTERMIKDLGYEDLSINYYSYESPTGVLDMIGVQNFKKWIGALNGNKEQEKAEPDMPVPMMMYLP